MSKTKKIAESFHNSLFEKGFFKTFKMPTKELAEMMAESFKDEVQFGTVTESYLHKYTTKQLVDMLNKNVADGGMKDEQSKAILLSFWDSAKKETLKMDLWTKEMPIDEMKSFMLQTFVSMKNSISKATGDESLVNLVDDFCAEFEKRVSEKN